MRGLWLVGLAALAVGGCQTRDEARGPISVEEFCARLPRSLASPAVDPALKAALTEKGRNAGCFGPALPQTIIVR